jgi:hypothetical protein
MQFERRVGRGANPFSEPYDVYQQRIVLAGMAKHLIEERKMPADKAYAEVARTGGVSKATVERAYAWQSEQHHDGLGAK